MATKTRKIEWSENSLRLMAEEIINSITGGKGISLEEYKSLASKTPVKKIGFSLAWILKNERRMKEFFPDEIISIISSRLNGQYRFDKRADYFIKTHNNMTANDIGALLFAKRSMVYRRASALGIPLKQERHSHSPQDDALIRKYVSTNLDHAAETIGVTWYGAFQRARRLGLHVPRGRSPKYSEKELEILKRADLAKKSDEEIARILKRRTAYSVSLKRREMGKKRRKHFVVWRRFPQKMQYLIDNYRSMTYRQIAREIKLTPSQVRSKAWAMGLKKIRTNKKEARCA